MENRTEILRKIKPSKIEEAILKIKINRFLGRLNKNLEGTEAILGGSVAKDTHLRGTSDVDIFVLYEKDKDISNKLEKSLKIFKDVDRLKGSRDYFQVTVYGLNFEIVPVLKIKNAKEAENITDVSPLHAEWVKKNTKRNLADEIRLAKTFCRAQGVYGAESYIKGFSGYVLEILTIYYGGFEKLIKNSLTWKEKQIIDISKHYKGINKSKESVLMVIDPVDSSRNAAAALSEEKLKKFVSACKGYLNNPDKNFFEKKKITLEYLADKDIVFLVKPLKGREDIIGSKLLKTLELINKKLIEEGYAVTESYWNWNNEALFWFKVKSEELPPFKKHYGPPKDKKDNLRSFKAKWDGYEIKDEGEKVYVNVPRKYTHLKDFAKDLIEIDEILMNVKEIKLVK